jgi:hypothetical protein
VLCDNDFILVLFSFVFVCRDLVASRRRQHIVLAEGELIVRRDEQDREARRVGGRTCFWRSSVMLTFR